MQKPGLYLKDDVIHRISGPMSMFYLRPRPTGKVFGVNGIRPDLPLVMLWGDHHKDDSNMCLDCECTLPENCCHVTYDKEFLKKLDKMAEDHPIDFYTEYSQTMGSLQLESEKNILFSKFLKNTTAKCHRKELRSQKGYSECPTTFIRWHYTDVRFMKHTIEYYIEAGLGKGIRNIHTSLKYFHTNFGDIMNDVSKQEQEEILIDQFDSIQDNIVKNTKSIKNESTSHSNLYNYGSKIQLDTLEILLKPYSSYQQHTRDENIRMKYKDLFSVWVDAISDPKKSIIYKQLTKSGIPQLLDKDLLVNFLTDCYLRFYFSEQAHTNLGFTYYNEEKLINDTDQIYGKIIYSIFQSVYEKVVSNKNITPWHDLIKLMMNQDSYTYIDVYTTMDSLLNILRFYILFINTIWLDLYMITRMLKPPKDNSPPLLVYGYFGDMHSSHISQILTDSRYFDYELVYHQKNVKNKIDSPYRCITINKPIYLYKDLVDHATSLYQYRKNKGYINAYERVKEQERLGREKTASAASAINLLPPTPPLSRLRYTVRIKTRKPLALQVERFITKGGSEKKRGKARERKKIGGRTITRRQRNGIRR